eukprot:CAMPEP_0113639548 /NCGR_PEP_ID=MMETSP0017_2-20120614/20748_1 /TAXON_ID=2856 /ORGANISM="Cylindrotheca closterium" /LENGTH=204 /DNA_ID=CAMNT_0000550769 /DNA_START=9 /DNA_END=622 /DNA_ORIENTATION=+ /assembly_acc=CAM_ASM_000147
MTKDSIIKRRSSYSKARRPPVASLRRRKSASDVLKPSTCRNDDEDNNNESPNPLVLKQENLNVSAGRTIYESARSRRERHRLALKNGMKLGEEDGSNHIVALGRGGARGPNRSSLTKEVPEGEDPGLLAIAASKRQAGRRKPVASMRRGGSTLGKAASKATVDWKKFKAEAKYFHCQDEGDASKKQNDFRPRKVTEAIGVRNQY